jgi:hypothetical protein
VYRVIFSGGIRFFIHVADFPADALDPGTAWHRLNPGVQLEEIFVSGGTAPLWDDDMVIYTGEARGGVLVCGSRASLGGRGRFY